MKIINWKWGFLKIINKYREARMYGMSREEAEKVVAKGFDRLPRSARRRLMKKIKG